MVATSTARGGPTRRECVKYGGAVIGGGMLAGCAGESSPSGGANASSGSGGSDGNSHSVTMAPVGEVGFESVPETWIANNGSI